MPYATNLKLWEVRMLLERSNFFANISLPSKFDAEGTRTSFHVTPSSVEQLQLPDKSTIERLEEAKLSVSGRDFDPFSSNCFLENKLAEIARRQTRARRKRSSEVCNNGLNNVKETPALPQS